MQIMVNDFKEIYTSHKAELKKPCAYCTQAHECMHPLKGNSKIKYPYIHNIRTTEGLCGPNVILSNKTV